MKIVIAEDHLMMREVLSKACSKDFGHQIVAEASDGPQTVKAVHLTNPDLLLLDLQLPGLNGFEVIALLREQAIFVKILILSSCCDEYTVYRVEKSDVVGFIDKNTGTIPVLGRALDAILKHNKYFSDEFKILSAERRSNPKSFDKFLTDRERTIMVLLSTLPTDRSVAQQLGISKETVEKHRSNIFKKLDLCSMAELLLYANTHGFNHLSISRVSR